MSSENNEKKVLSRRKALKRCATLTLGVAAMTAGKLSIADSYSSSSYSSFRTSYSSWQGGGVRG